MFAFLVLAVSALVHPYEFDWANRIADDHPPLTALASADGWTVSAVDAVARLETNAGRWLFDDGAVTLVHHATGPEPVITIRAAAPIAVGSPFDMIGCWIFGNNHAYMKRADTPPVTVYADFEDSSGAPLAVKLDHVHYKEWFHPIAKLRVDEAARVADGKARFLGFTITGGTNPADREISFASFSVFTDEQKPLSFTARPKRPNRVFPDAPAGINTGDGELPFPDSPLGIVPKSEPLEGLEFRFPESDTDWSELAFRYRGGEWQRFAVGGGVIGRGEGVTKTRFHVEGRALIADVESTDEVEEVRFGAWTYPPDCTLVEIPYYHYVGWPVSERPAVIATTLEGRPFFLAAHVDWTQSNASEPYARTTYGTRLLIGSNGGVRYHPKTDGARNPCYERFVWIFSDDFADVLPVIPNPASPYRGIAGSNVWRSHHAGDRASDAAYWRARKARGLDHLVITDHEVGWRDGNESFTFRTETAPKKGGDKGQFDYARILIDELGYFYGPYNNFTDFAPVNGFWDIDHVSRTREGALASAWDRCYAPKPAWAVGMCEKLTPVIQGKFRFNTAYCDVHSCVTPWSRTDYDARVPGGGTFAGTFYAFGEIFLLQKAVWGGPVYSEGGCHFLYCGLTDGNYAQDQFYVFKDNPWLVDFDLLRMHPKCCNFGMGDLNMFYAGMSGYTEAERETEIDRYLAATMAFGHSGFLLHGEPYEDRSYFMIQAIAAHYTQAEAVQISYLGADGTAYSTSEAVLNGAYRRSQVVCAYSDGTITVVNGSPDEKLVFGNLELPPNGYFASTEDGATVVFAGLQDGRRVDLSLSPEYWYEDRRDGVKPVIRLAKDGTDGWPTLDFAELAGKSHIPDGFLAKAEPRHRLRFERMDSGIDVHLGVHTSGGLTRTGLSMQPKEGREAVAVYTIKPEAGRLILFVGRDDGEAPSSVAHFKAMLGSKMVAERTLDKGGWERIEIPLEGGAAARLTLSCDGAMTGVACP